MYKLDLMENINSKKREILKKAGIGIVGLTALSMIPPVLARARFIEDGNDLWLVDKNGNISFVDLNVKGSLDVEGGNIRGLSTKTTDYTILPTDYTILADASSNPVTITLPASPKQGQIFHVFCIDSTFTCTVERNGNNINGDAEDRRLVVNQSESYQFDNTAKWVAINKISDPNFSYTEIDDNEFVTIPTNQQMAVFGTFTLDGKLNLNGSLILRN